MSLAENDTVATIDTESGDRIWLYPRLVMGRFMKARTLAHWALVIGTLIMPWISVGGAPALFLDIEHRRFYVMGLTLFATDANYLVFFLLSMLFSVFFFTALLGRAWCGWACPQTIFLESIIRPVERFIEGKPSARKKLDKAPWGPNKILRKGLKYIAFIAIAALISIAFQAYFIGTEGIFNTFKAPGTHSTAVVFATFMTGILSFNFLYFREQTCTVACPYGRFQSVLMDADSIAVVYDEARGEPRGKPRDPEAGDCIDCKACLQVCPTGIDIRKGVQMECVNCAACIDACDDVMLKVHRAPGLISYISENQLAGKPRRLVRPRIIAYGLALSVVLTVFVYAVAQRQPVELQLNRFSGSPFVMLPDGNIQNMMELRVANKAGEVRHFKVEVIDPPTARANLPVGEIVVDAGQVKKYPVFIIRDDPKVRRSSFILRVTDDHGFSEDVEGVFLARKEAK